MDLQLFRHEILRYWAGAPKSAPPNQPPVYRRMRIGAARRNSLGATASDSWRTVTAALSRAEWLSRYSATVLPDGTHVWHKGDDGLWCLGRSTRARLWMGYIWCAFWMTRDRSSSLLLRRATRRRLERYGVVGVYKYA